MMSSVVLCAQSDAWHAVVLTFRSCEIMASSDTRAAEASDRAMMPAPDLIEHDRQVEKGIGASPGGPF